MSSGCGNRINAKSRRYIPKARVPNHIDTHQITVTYYPCSACKSVYWVIAYNDHNNVEHPQRHVVREPYWFNLGDVVKPNKNDVRPLKTTHSEYTDEIHLDTQNVYDRIIRREGTFNSLYGMPGVWQQLAEANRERVAGYQAKERRSAAKAALLPLTNVNGAKL